MKYKKIIFWNFILVITFFAILEIFARNLFPEFKNRRSFSVNTENLIYGKILNKNFFSKKYDNFWVARVKNKDYKFDFENKEIFLILGDSITNGFGMPYEDIYWVKMQKKILLDKRFDEKLKFLPISSYGNDLSDSLKTINGIEDNLNSSVKYIMYQFNFNDLLPSELKVSRNYTNTKLINLIAQIKYNYLDNSVFISWLTNYIGSRKRSLDNCNGGNSTSLNSYSFTYGSRGFKDLSKKAWLEFEDEIEKLVNISKNIEAEFLIFISPILYDIDEEGIHKFHSPKYINFSCTTINPRDKINKIANKFNIKVIDPKEYLKKGLNSYLEEGNFQPFFYTADPNHFNSKASEYIADYLYFNIFSE